MPGFSTQGSACFDLAAWIPTGQVVEGFDKDNNPLTRVSNGGIILEPGTRLLIPTGLKVSIPKGHYVEIYNRSSTAYKKGLVLFSSRVIDSDFIYEWMLPMANMSNAAYVVSNGDRIAQGRLIKLLDYGIVESSVEPTDCGDRTGGFGSTGI